MKEAAGDLWVYPADWRVVTTNGVVKSDGDLVMGKGVALQAVERFPWLALKLGFWTNRYGSRVFICRQEHLIAFPTKDDWRKPSRIEIIENSLRQLVELADKYKLKNIILPPPGCGNGCLNFHFVRPLLKTYLDDRFTVVHLSASSVPYQAPYQAPAQEERVQDLVSRWAEMKGGPHDGYSTEVNEFPPSLFFTSKHDNADTEVDTQVKHKYQRKDLLGFPMICRSADENKKHERCFYIFDSSEVI